MKRIVISLASVFVLGGIGFAAEGIVPANVPVVQQDEQDEFFYIGAALIYQRTYSIHNGWFDSQRPTQDETGGFTGTIGYNYNEYLAFEGRISKSFFSEDYADVFNYSFFVKPQYRFWDEARRSSENKDYFTLYGLLGFGNVNVQGADGNMPGHPENVGKTILDESDFQWGVGVSYTFVDEDSYDSEGDISLYFEYTRLMDDGAIDSMLYGYDGTYYDQLSQDAVSAGMTYRF